MRLTIACACLAVAAGLKGDGRGDAPAPEAGIEHRTVGGGFDVSARLTGAGDETAPFRAVVAANRHVRIPAGFTVSIGGPVPVPADTLIEGPGSVHLMSRSARLTLAERCVVRGVRFTCAPAFAHGSAIAMAAATQGTTRRMDCRITGCRFEAMRGHALEAVEVSHVVFENNTWENHSPASLFYNPTLLKAVSHGRFHGNTILHGNQALLFRGGWHNVVTNNYIENCLQGITCHTTGGHPKHWPYTLFAHNVIANNVIRRLREEGICYDNSMGETPAINAAQNRVRAVATVKAAAPVDANRFRVTLNEAANPGQTYAGGWADGYYAGFLTGGAAGTLLEVIASGADDGAFLDLPRHSANLPARIRPGDRVWVAAGCFYNTVVGNVVDNTGMVSGRGNATCIGFWGAAWHNVIAGNVCTTRQYGITLGCVGLAAPESPQGPCAGNTISHNVIAASWRSGTTTFEGTSVGAIAYCWIGDGPLLDGRLFLGNSITHNTISWAGRHAFRLGRDCGTYVGFNRVSDESAAIHLDHTADARFEGNRTATGALILRADETGPCTYRFLDAGPRPTVWRSDHTLELADADGGIVEMEGQDALRLIVPASAAVPFPLGARIDVIQGGSGPVTVVAGPGVTIRTSRGLQLARPYAVATLLKRGPDEWLLFGDLVEAAALGHRSPEALRDSGSF